MDAMRQLLFSRLMRSSHNRLCPDQRTVFPARQNTTSLRSFFPTALLWYSVVIKWSRSPTEGIKENKSRLFFIDQYQFFFVSFFLFSFLAFSRWGRSPNASHRFGSIRPIWWLSVRRSCLMGPLSRRVRQLLLLHKRKGQKINGKNRRDCVLCQIWFVTSDCRSRVIHQTQRHTKSFLFRRPSFSPSLGCPSSSIKKPKRCGCLCVHTALVYTYRTCTIYSYSLSLML